ncbi:MAG: hypothetical protein K2Q03_00145 [Sphingobacteriaceae bacterium]|nr:hypothetical protein [Sphingobacteriaceae bacterium]
MEITTDLKNRLATLISSPDLVRLNDAEWLKNLVEKYPYFEPLHLLLAKATQNTSFFEQNCNKAAFFGNRALLYQLLHHPKELKSQFLNANDTNVIVEEIISSDNSVEIFEEISEVNFVPQAQKNGEEISTENASQEEEVFEEISEVNFIAEESIYEEETLLEEISIENASQEEVFEEISEVNFTTNTTIPVNIEEPFVETLYENEENTDLETVVKKEQANPAEDTQKISKYDDDKLPYSFLWWLSKTRREYQESFQPYVFTKKGSLDHQYVEHVFHLQTPFHEKDLNERPIKAKNENRRDIKIIDNFIAADPQIRPLAGEKIDNENKGKKSAEDKNDVVSETLAAIYTEQMLYQKAIDIYKKLSLKFPEKSRYFAKIIKSLEKKM